MKHLHSFSISGTYQSLINTTLCTVKYSVKISPTYPVQLSIHFILTELFQTKRNSTAFCIPTHTKVLRISHTYKNECHVTLFINNQN